MKAVVTGKVMTLNAYITREISKVNNINFQLWKFFKKQIQYKVRTSITKFRAEINEFETMKSIEKVHQNKSCFFER